MPRAARLVLPDYPHHIIQRGHNRAPVFVNVRDYRFFLSLLAEWKTKLGCKVHAYCLMTNHVHLVIDPGRDAQSLGRLMKRVAGKYTRYVNRIEGRSGTVWNGRYNSSPVETDRYFMACCRYIELNPVRAKIVASPEQYAWSSHAHHAGLAHCDWLDEHPLYWNFGATRSERGSSYREWIRSSVPDGEWALIRAAVTRGQLTGGRRLQDMVEKRLGRRVELRGRGRPPGRKSKSKNKSVPF